MTRTKSALKKALHKIYHAYFYLTNTSKSHTINEVDSYAILHLSYKFLKYAYGRHVYIICKYLEFAGFTVIFKTDYKYLSSHIKYKALLVKQNIRFVRFATTPVDTITFITPNRKAKQLNLIFGDQLRQVHFDCFAPYPMHPNQYAQRHPTAYHSLRTFDRPMRIFFAGNVSEEAYNNSDMEAEFNVISRHKVISHLKKHFDQSGRVKLISNIEQLRAITNTKSTDNSIIISEARTDPGEWLDVLSKSSFFIAPPGIQLPWSHNTVEALAVGTIPILQYSKLFDPELIHLENCLCYNSLSELGVVIETALHMESSEIMRMQNNAAAYFDKYLSVESVLKRINAFINSDPDQVTMGIPFVRLKT